MSKGNFKVKHVGNKFMFTKNKVYKIANGLLLDDEGDIRPVGRAEKFRSFKDLDHRFPGDFEEVKETGTKTININCHSKKVVASITDGENTYTQYVKLSDANGDFKKAVKMVVDRLMDKWNGFEIKEIEAVDKPYNIVKQDSYEARDKVMVREDISKFDSFGCLSVTKNMQRMGGKILTIEETSNNSWGWRCFAKENSYAWSAECFEGKVVESTKPTVKEVHRPAEVGEWVKILHTDYPGAIDIGDICKVVSTYEGKAMVADNNGGHPEGLCFFCREYNVLENYQPEEPNPFVKAKVGDKIKVVNINYSSQIPPLKLGDEHIVTRVESDGVWTEPGNYFDDRTQRYVIVVEAPQPECFHCHSTTNVFMVEGIPICRVCSRKISMAHVEGEDVHTR